MSVDHEIKNNNPWYTDEQFEMFKNPSVKKVYQERWNFFDHVTSQITKPDQNLKLLDAGCGDGINLLHLCSLPNTQVTAFDYNPLRVERTKNRFDGIEAFQADLTDLKYKGSKFDLIILSQVLEHINQDSLVVKNLKSLLEENGRLIIGVPNEGCLFAQLRNNVFQPSISKTTDHVNFYTEKNIKKIFDKEGLEVEDVMYEGFFYPHSILDSVFYRPNLLLNFTYKLGRLFNSMAAGYYFSLKIKR